LQTWQDFKTDATRKTSTAYIILFIKYLYFRKSILIIIFTVNIVNTEFEQSFSNNNALDTMKVTISSMALLDS